MQPLDDVGYLFQHVAGVLYRQSDQTLQERLGIGLSQFRILGMLGWRPNIKQRQLASYLGQTEASISRQIKLLQEKGMVITEIDPSERRQHLATPTPKGLKITQAAREILAEHQAPLFSRFSEKQQQQFREMLTQMHEYCCAANRPGACDQPFDIETIYANQTIK